MARGVKGSGRGTKSVSARAARGTKSKVPAAKDGRGGYTAPTLSTRMYDPGSVETALRYAAGHKGVVISPSPSSTTLAPEGFVDVAVPMPTKIGVKALLKTCKRNEPIFVLRAQDALAPGLVRQWASEAARLGVNAVKVALAEQLAEAMEKWPGRRLPD